MGRLPLLPRVNPPGGKRNSDPKMQSNPPPSLQGSWRGGEGDPLEKLGSGLGWNNNQGGKGGSGGAQAGGDPLQSAKGGRGRGLRMALEGCPSEAWAAGGGRSSRSFVLRLPSEGPRPPRRPGTAGLGPLMAPGRALALAALLWAVGRAGVPSDDEDEALISAPPELLAKVPAAAQATVAAGYLSPSEEEAEATKELPRAPAAPAGSPPTHETVLIVGDTRYAWQEWSAWHCNCPGGSMARVRDITYAVPAVRLDPAHYDLLRFERVVCSYAVCACSRQKRQCDLLAPACDLGQAHLCALRDIQRDQDEKRRRFWAKVHRGLKKLWRSLKEAFPRDKKKSKTIQVKSL